MALFLRGFSFEIRRSRSGVECEPSVPVEPTLPALQLTRHPPPLRTRSDFTLEILRYNLSYEHQATFPESYPKSFLPGGLNPQPGSTGTHFLNMSSPHSRVRDRPGRHLSGPLVIDSFQLVDKKSP